MNIYYVYSHLRLDTNTPFYVGKGKHKRAYRTDSRSEEWNKIAVNGFKVCILVQGLTEKEAYEKEIEFIGKYKSLGFAEANFALGGKGPLGGGWRLSDETKRRISESNIGKHPMTEERREFLRRINTGRPAWNKGMKVFRLNYKPKPHSEETRRKIANSKLGTKLSKETRQKMSKSRMGLSSKPVVDLSTGFIWSNVKEASYIYNIKYSTLVSKLNGRNPNETNLRYV